MLDTIAMVNDFAGSIGVVLAHTSDLVVAKMNSNGLVNNIRGFLGPILLLIIGIVAITFLFQRQMTQFIIFLVIGVVVAGIFYVPDVIGGLGKSFGNSTKSWG